MVQSAGRDPESSRLPRALAMVAGLGLVGVVGANAMGVDRLRRRADEHNGELGPVGVVGDGLGEPLRLLVLGDSAARGFGLPSAAESFPALVGAGLARATGRRVDVRSLATDGHRTADVLAEQAPLVRAHAPDVVVISVGVNDAVRGTSRSDLLASTRALADCVAADVDSSDVAFVTCPDLQLAPGLPRPLNRLVGLRCRRVARAQDEALRGAPVRVVDLPRAEVHHYGPDGFHPGVAGHLAMAERAVGRLMPATT